MEKKRVSSTSPFEAVIGFSRAVRIGKVIKVSGTAPIAPEWLVEMEAECIVAG